MVSKRSFLFFALVALFSCVYGMENKPKKSLFSKAFYEAKVVEMHDYCTKKCTKNSFVTCVEQCKKSYAEQLEDFIMKVSVAQCTGHNSEESIFKYIDKNEDEKAHVECLIETNKAYMNQLFNTKLKACVKMQIELENRVMQELANDLQEQSEVPETSKHLATVIGVKLWDCFKSFGKHCW